jgi:hypothetical protein
MKSRNISDKAASGGCVARLVRFFISIFFIGSICNSRGEVLTFSDLLSHGLRVERWVGNDLHYLQPLDNEGLQRLNFVIPTVTSGSSLGHLDASLKVDQSELHPEFTKMMALGGPCCPLCGRCGNLAAYHDPDQSEHRGDNSNDASYNDWFHVILCGVVSGFIGIGVGSLYLAIKLGLFPLANVKGVARRRKDVQSEANEGRYPPLPLPSCSLLGFYYPA